MSESETSFKINDRRRFAAESSVEEHGPSGAVDSTAGTTGGGESAPEQVRDTAAADQDHKDTEGSPREEETGAGMPDLSTADLLQFTVASLAQLAWQHLGLMPNPSTGKVDTRLEEARLAIDAIGALLPLLHPKMEEPSRRELQNLLANLRINFVEQSKRQKT